jgi:uncharacterized protein (DUF2126 family)
MSLVQTLLLRAFVATFWDKPYQKPLVNWGNALQDRFMLPHVLWADLQQVLAYLNDNGLPFRSHWFEAFFEFRCPRIGRLELAGLQLEVRHALEPWHVLGEEATTTGTSRYVDSSVERLQVKLKYGTPGDRYSLLCNGKVVPLVPTEEEGEYIAGIRYRAWQPPSALHPMIGVHSPLVFDVFDTWNGRSMGGCTYHVVHPGGRNYDAFPVNALEAEARRVGRFEELGHSHGRLVASPLLPFPEAEKEPRFLTPPQQATAIRQFQRNPPKGRGDLPPPPKPNPSYPFTLDLRFDQP